MNKMILALAALLLLSGCANTPDTISIQSTVDAAVTTAMAPYESRYNDFVTNEELVASQDDQNLQIQQYIADRIEMEKNSIQQEQPTADAQDSSVEIEYKDGVASTATPVAYNYDNADCLDGFTYISDLTVPDGMTIPPNTQFPKSWYIKNSGTCTWNSNYKIVYNSGNLVGTSKSFPMLQPGYYIKPGESTVVTVNLVAPNQPETDFSTSWAIENDKGEIFGAGEAKNIYLSSNFRVTQTFYLSQNLASMKCSDQYGALTCGVTSTDGSRGSIYVDYTPTVESQRSPGVPAVAVQPPAGENTSARFEFGPLRFPRGSYFYTNYSCRPDSPLCDVQVRLYIREPGYAEKLVVESRKFNDGLSGEWKFKLDDQNIFDQDFYYILEVESIGGSEEDLILFWNTHLY